ncbi:MAG: hypothetical protein JJT75_12710 [Opitutales bacterium]|nr:hypothetical protein [Opitutales bacterium]MCH8539608.1 hypothetical protein [Opitutales bacterium]
MWRNFLQYFQRDNLLTQALNESHRMLRLDLEMYQASVHSLREHEQGGFDIDVLQKDKEINRFEREVRQKVLTHLTVSGASDLQSGLVLVSIIIDIERIGDYAKNIYDLAEYHTARLDAGSLEERLGTVEKKTTEIFSSTVKAFQDHDVDLAREVMHWYKDSLSKECEEIIRHIIEGKAPDLNAPTATAVSLYARYLKRIGGHSRNIVTSVVNPFHRIGYKEKKLRDL